MSPTDLEEAEALGIETDILTLEEIEEELENERFGWDDPDDEEEWGDEDQDDDDLGEDEESLLDDLD